VDYGAARRERRRQDVAMTLASASVA